MRRWLVKWERSSTAAREVSSQKQVSFPQELVRCRQGNQIATSWTAEQEEVVAGDLGCSEPLNAHSNDRIKNELERRSEKTRGEVVAAIEVGESQS